MAEANGSIAETEFAYKPPPESEVWVADVVCISSIRERRITKWLEGSPELAIEVKSPGNTKAELHDKAMTTLAGQGSIEFWIVDSETQTVTVYNKTTGMQIYHRSSGQSLPVPMFAALIDLDQLFPCPA